MGKTREDILATAKVLFHQFGFEKTSIDEIARISHKAKGSIYYHFRSKDELFDALIDDELVKFKSTLLEVVNEENISPLDKINKYILKRMELIYQAYSYKQVIKKSYSSYDALINDKIDKTKAQVDLWEEEQILTILSPINSESMNVKVVSEMIILVLKGLENHFFVQNRYEESASTFTNLINLITDSLRFKISTDFENK